MSRPPGHGDDAKVVVGISCDYHDAAAAVVVDGEVVAAAEQERFSRRKHDPSMPVDALASGLAIAGLDATDVDAVVFHHKPLVAAGRVLASRQRRGVAALATFVRESPGVLGEHLMVASRLDDMFRSLGAPLPPVAYGEHHLSHAAAAFLPSPFPTAAVLTVDGIGEWAASTIGHGLHHRVDLLEEQRFPHSLGLLYSLVTSWCGFRPNDGEYKLMGLAPYGEPSYREALERLVGLDEDGGLHVDGRAVRWWSSGASRSRRLAKVLGGPPRRPDEPISVRECDLARSVQELTEDALLRMARRAHRITGERALCLAGGVALNCVATGRLQREGPFDEVWVQPAAGDAGSAIGSALWYWHDVAGHPRDAVRRVGDVTSLGPAFAPDEIEGWLVDRGIAHRRFADRAELYGTVAERLAAGAVVGWFEGRMEFGPRALGHRSILADPRGPTTHRDLNLRVKGREGFRPFAPAVLAERAAEWFDIDRPSPHMSFTYPVAESVRVAVDHEPDTIAERAEIPRSLLAACTHVDGSARVQTVHAEASPAFWGLLAAFDERTGCPVLLNTSFNVADEPIVCTPEHALDTARRARLDLVVLEDCVVEIPDAGS